MVWLAIENSIRLRGNEAERKRGWQETVVFNVRLYVCMKDWIFYSETIENQDSTRIWKASEESCDMTQGGRDNTQL